MLETSAINVRAEAVVGLNDAIEFYLKVVREEDLDQGVEPVMRNVAWYVLLTPSKEYAHCSS